MIGDCPIHARRGRSRLPGLKPPIGGARSTYATAGVSSVFSDMTSDEICRLIQAAIKEALPLALTSAFATSTSSFPYWHLDSTAYNHMTHSRNHFANLKSAPTLELQFTNGSRLSIQGIRQVVHKDVCLSDTLYVPTLVPSLVSVG
ncbi:hypothetical protein LINGRAHAP2_LOCUS2077 [Linum grandiflorum]